MKSQGTLLLLLIAGGSLIYSASRQPRYDMPHTRTQTEHPDSSMRMAKAGYAAQHDIALPRFTADSMARRVDRLMAKALDDVASGQDVIRFVCKRPAEVGPVPSLDAVDAWLRATPDSHADPYLLDNLHRAAQQGNWLAKVQVFLALNGQRAPDDTTAFRTITLMEWMQEHRIGALYAAVGETMGASGGRHAEHKTAVSSLDIYAAMHHNYPSQYKVGRELLRSGDARQVDVGRRMLDCAARALPVYGEMYGEDVLAARG
ncbi:hypothetical protein GJV26_18060 [Massilia dura]|uniref:Uncharacterized protein n=1 Tax=Pseudoduganella dura TaxID=321982 RepID=A0A6I3XL30_9BURK|nr:hypothetical protein [Pseudoduganella dura]MUI14351.1 hypothetical protein [Pseudoduganella dura]GGY20658.1 hypothetical protein GCM10007386_57080 [Pseudoduganella dura]